MQTIGSGSFRPSTCGPGETAATQGTRGFQGSSQDRADQLVRATVLSDLGQSRGHGHHGSSIDRIAAAIQKVLLQSDVTGTDAPDGVLNKIEQSLHKAAQKLADRGVDAKTIDATIDKFRSQLAGALDKLGGSAGTGSPGSPSGTSGTTGGTTAPPATNPPATTPAPSTVISATTSVAREVRKERGTIDLVTAEGDKVSIRFRTKEVVAGSVTQTTRADGTQTTASTTSLSTRGGIKVEVDGDLNDEERAAIGDLLDKVDAISTKFFSGDVQTAFAAANSLDVSSDQIASYQLDLTYSRKVAASARSVTRVGALDPGSSGLRPPASNSTMPDAAASGITGAATNVAVAPASNVSTPNAPSTTAPSVPDTPGSAPTDTAASDTPAAGTPPVPPPPVSARKTITDFIGDVLSKLGSVKGAGRVAFSAHWKLNVLVTSLEARQPANPTTPTEASAARNTQLLNDSLQKTAAA